MSCPDNSTTVTARFEDGTSATGTFLVGTDGANSKVREFLLGSEKSALKHLPLLGMGAVECMPAEVARKFRDLNDIYVLAYHPQGPENVCVFISRMLLVKDHQISG